jgi:hypothetical protein
MNPTHPCIQELSQVLLERLGSEAIAFMPVSAALLTDPPHLHDELVFIDAISREMFQSVSNQRAAHGRSPT